MSAATTEPRRFKLASELDDDERAASRQFGASGKVERAEYIAWRRETLKTERDDLALRERLLREEAETLRTRAGRRTTAALEAMSPEEHIERMALEPGHGDGPAPPVDEKAGALDARAAALEAEAQEIKQHLAEDHGVSVEEHLERLGGNR